MPKNEPDYGKLSADALNRAVLKEDEEMKRDGEALFAGTYAIYNKHDLTLRTPVLTTPRTGRKRKPTKIARQELGPLGRAYGWDVVERQ